MPVKALLMIRAELESGSLHQTREGANCFQLNHSVHLHHWRIDGLSRCLPSRCQAHSIKSVS